MSPPSDGGGPPGHSSSNPGHGGTPPGQGGTPPGQSDNNPGHGGTPPGQGGTPPGQSDSNPGHGGTPPGHGGTPPGQSDGNPGPGNGNPGHGGTPPGQTENNGTLQPSTGATAASTTAPATPAPAAPAPTVTTQTPLSPPISTPLPSTPSSPTIPGTTSSGPFPGISITSLAVRGAHGLSGAAIRAGAGGVLGSAARGVFAGNPLTTAFAPGTAAAVTPRTGTTTFSHRGQQVRTIVVPPSSSPATVISRFISRIPAVVWIVLATALALAALGGGAAVAFGRRASRRAGEVAAVTAAALTDQLTGVLNRRGFTDSAEREFERARRYGHPLALAYVDVRGLKAVNDSEGHAAGDRLIKEVALLLNRSARTHDLVGRMGGDELAVLLAEQSAAGADAMTRRVREQVPQHREALGLTTAWDVTIGTSSFPEDGDTLEGLLEAADRRMYEQRGIELQAN